MTAVVFITACDGHFFNRVQENLSGYSANIRSIRIKHDEIQDEAAIQNYILLNIQSSTLQNVTSLHIVVLADLNNTIDALTRSVYGFANAVKMYYDVKDICVYGIVDIFDASLRDNARNKLRGFDAVKQLRDIPYSLYFLDNNINDRDFEAAARAAAMNIFIIYLNQHIEGMRGDMYQWLSLRHVYFDLFEFSRLYIKERRKYAEINTIDEGKAKEWQGKIDNILSNYRSSRNFSHACKEMLALPVNGGILKDKTGKPDVSKKTLKRLGKRYSVNEIEHLLYGTENGRTTASMYIRDNATYLVEKLTDDAEMDELANKMLGVGSLWYSSGTQAQSLTQYLQHLKKKCSEQDCISLNDRYLNDNEMRDLSSVISSVLKHCHEQEYLKLCNDRDAAFFEKLIEAVEKNKPRYQEEYRKVAERLHLMTFGKLERLGDVCNVAFAELLNKSDDNDYEINVKAKENSVGFLKWLKDAAEDGEHPRTLVTGLANDSQESVSLLISPESLYKEIKDGNFNSILDQFNDHAGYGAHGCTFEILVKTKSEKLENMRLLFELDRGGKDDSFPAK